MFFETGEVIDNCLSHQIELPEYFKRLKVKPFYYNQDVCRC